MPRRRSHPRPPPPSGGRSPAGWHHATHSTSHRRQTEHCNVARESAQGGRYRVSRTCVSSLAAEKVVRGETCGVNAFLTHIRQRDRVSLAARPTPSTVQRAPPRLPHTSGGALSFCRLATTAGLEPAPPSFEG